MVVQRNKEAPIGGILRRRRRKKREVGDEDESIEDYMAQLMQRVGGGSGEAPSPVEAQATLPTPTQTPTQQQEVLPEEEPKQRRWFR